MKDDETKADDDELALRRKEVEVDPLDDDEAVEKVKRDAFPPFSAYFFKWLESERATEVVKTITDLTKSVKEVALSRLGEVDKQAHSREMVDRIARYLMMAGIIGVATVLKFYDKLDTVIVGLLSLALGFVFGRQTSQK